jgi:D-tyrosyl-tRNA(Tyr) deacylase
MRAVVQRVSQASVEVEGREVSRIGPGLLVLLGVGRGDEDEDARALADKVAGLRIFEDEQGKMNRSLLETGGELLVVSQFTLLGDARKGRRPSFIDAEEPGRANELYQGRRGHLPRRHEGGAGQRRSGHAAARQQEAVLADLTTPHAFAPAALHLPVRSDGE